MFRRSPRSPSAISMSSSAFATTSATLRSEHIEFVTLLLDRSPSMGTRDYQPSRLQTAQEGVSDRW